MANRCILHKTHLEDFKKWLIDNDWILVDTKGDYEVLRAKKDGRQHPLIIYEKIDAKQHYSVMDRDIPIIKAFLEREDTNKGKEFDINDKEFSNSLMALCILLAHNHTDNCDITLKTSAGEVNCYIEFSVKKEAE